MLTEEKKLTPEEEKFWDDFVSPGPIPELMAMKLTGGVPETDELTPEQETSREKFRKLLNKIPNCEIMTPETEEIQRKWGSKMGVLTASREAVREIFELLNRIGMDDETALTLSLRVRRAEHQPKMLEWLRANPDATPMEAVLKSREIVGRGNQKEG